MFGSGYFYNMGVSKDSKFICDRPIKDGSLHPKKKSELGRHPQLMNMDHRVYAKPRMRKVAFNFTICHATNFQS
jgi:hypothetical protein